MIKEYKNIIILSIAIVVVVVGAVFVPRVLRNKKPAANTAVVAPTPCLEGESFSTATGAPCPKPEAPTIAPTTVEANNRASSYAQTLAQYNGKTVSIGEQCAMSPQALVVNKGTRFLLVNSGKNAATLTYGTETITLKPLRYATRIAQSEQMVQCGTQKTTVTVQ